MTKHTCRCTCTAYGGHCDCWFHGNVKGRAEGASAERARIIARIRWEADHRPPTTAQRLRDMADEIENERGDAGEGGGLEFVRYCFWVKDRGMPQISGDRPASWVEQITVAHPKGKKRWNGGGSGNVWRYPVVANCSGHRNDRIHTAQKPIELMTHIVGLFSDEGETVLDPFAGSATTGVACLRLGRYFAGIERAPRADHPEDANYFQIACDRLTAAARAPRQVPMFGAAQ